MGKKYEQTFRNHMSRIGEPKRTPATVASKKLPDFVEIRSSPDYKHAGYDPLMQSDIDEITDWLRWRCALASAYTGLDISFNDEKISYNNPAKLLELITPESKSYMFKLKSPDLTWECALSQLPKGEKFSVISLVNGVICERGSHIAYVKKQISNRVKEELKGVIGDSVNMTDICKSLMMILICRWPQPSWSGQTKNEIKQAEKTFSSYKLDMDKGVVQLLVNHTLATLNKKQAKKKVTIDKYTSAENAGKKAKSQECNLLLAEGDSALMFIRRGLTSNKLHTFKNCGMLSLGGVIMNVTRKINEYESEDQVVKIKSEKLDNNVFISSIIQVLNLEYGKKYTRNNLSDLNYGSVVACVDQDWGWMWKNHEFIIELLLRILA